MRVWSYLLGLVAGLERANGWTVAEFAWDATPDGMQRQLAAARWEEDAVGDALVRYVAAELGDPGGVLIADESGSEETGRRSVISSPDSSGSAVTAARFWYGFYLGGNTLSAAMSTPVPTANPLVVALFVFLFTRGKVLRRHAHAVEIIGQAGHLWRGFR